MLPICRNGTGIFKSFSRDGKRSEFREISQPPLCAPPQQSRCRRRTQDFDESTPKNVEYLRRRAGSFVARGPWESIEIFVHDFHFFPSTSGPHDFLFAGRKLDRASPTIHQCRQVRAIRLWRPEQAQLSFSAPP